MEQKSIEQLKSAIALAATSGDDLAFNTLIKEYNARKADIAKALAAQALKEAEALAGVRQKLAISLHKAVVRIPGIAKDLADVKATGFTYKVDADGITHLSVALTVPTVKAARQGGGGGKGKTKAEFGMSLADIMTAFGSAEEKTKAAELKAQGREGRADATLYTLQMSVKKRAIADGSLKPIS